MRQIYRKIDKLEVCICRLLDAFCFLIGGRINVWIFLCMCTHVKWAQVSCALCLHAGFNTSGLIKRTTFMKNFWGLWEFQTCLRSFFNIFKKKYISLTVRSKTGFCVSFQSFRNRMRDLLIPDKASKPWFRYLVFLLVTERQREV